jgi:hypothetical protein
MKEMSEQHDVDYLQKPLTGGDLAHDPRITRREFVRRGFALGLGVTASSFGSSQAAEQGVGSQDETDEHFSSMQEFVRDAEKELGIAQEHEGEHHGEFDPFGDVNDATALMVSGLFAGIIAGAATGRLELNKKTAAVMNAANALRLGALWESGTRADTPRHKPENKDLAIKEAIELAKGYGILFGVLVPMTEIAHYMEMSPQAIISDEKLLENVPMAYDRQLFDVDTVEGYFSDKDPLVESTSIDEVKQRLEHLSLYAIAFRGRMDGINTAIAPVFSTYISASYSNSLMEAEYRLHHEIHKLEGILAYASEETRTIGDIPKDERRIIAEHAVEKTNNFFNNPFGVQYANQTREANVRGAKGVFGDPPIPFQIALNLPLIPSQPVAALSAIGISQAVGAVNSELLNNRIARKYFSQMRIPDGMNLNHVMDMYKNAYVATIRSSLGAVAEYVVMKGLVNVGDLLNRDVNYTRRRTQYVKDVIVPQIQEMQSLEGALSKEEWDNFYNALDLAIKQDAILLDWDDVLVKVAKAYGRLGRDGEGIQVHEEVESDKRLASLRNILEHIGPTDELGGVHILDELNLEDINEFQNLFDIDMSLNDIVHRLKIGDTSFFAELGAKMQNIVESDAGRRYSAKMQEFFAYRSPDLDEAHGHDDEGHDTEQILEDAPDRILPHHFSETIEKTKLTSRKLSKETIGTRLIAVANGTERYEDLFRDLNTLSPDEAIDMISEATRRAAGPMSDNLSHKTKEVIGAITTQLPSVESLVHLAEKVIASIDNPYIKRNVIIAIGGMMTMGADNIAAYLFMRKMFMILDKERYGKDVYKKHPLMHAAADSAGIQVAILMGAGTRIGNAPALGQKDLKGKMKQATHAAFDRLEVEMEGRTLGNSAKNGYTMYCAAVSAISANALLEAGRAISQPERVH